MPWQRHRRYYYRSERRGQQVRSVYMGCDEIAAEWAEYETQYRALCQRAQQAEREAWREVCDAMKHEDAMMIELGCVIDLLATAVLYVSGYHQHRYVWRKRRAANDNASRGNA